MDQIPWLALPYLAFVSFVLGHVWRFRHDRFATSERDEDRVQRLGRGLFRGGMLAAIMARLAELLVPGDRTQSAVMPETVYHLSLVSIEVVAAMAAFVGAAILLSWIAPTTTAVTGWSDRVVLPVLAVGLLTGMAILFEPDNYQSRTTLFVWFHSLFTADPEPDLMAHALLIYQTRALVVLTVIGIWPYTRLVYIFTVPIGFLIRSATRRLRRPPSPRLADVG